MRPAVVLLCWSLAASPSPARQATPSEADSPGADLLSVQRVVFQQAIEAAAAYIVRIDTIGGADPVTRDDQGEARVTFKAADGPTTGVIWSADGHIITSSLNFVHEPSVITVRLPEGRRFVARLVARDYPSRLALLKIDANDLSPPPRAVREGLRPGQWALAAGYGYGSAEPAVSVGVISAIARMDGRALQTDAKISPANYGGPLFDIEGRLLGICVPLAAGEDQVAGTEWYDSGIGFAIHTRFVDQRYARLRKGEDLHRGLIGVFFDDREPVVGGEGQDAASPPVPGLLITQDPQGPAREAGLKKDDVVTRVVGVECPNAVTFRRAIASNAAGDEIEIEYWRDGASHTASLRLMSSFELSESLTSQPAQEP
jgi:serine protease Do